jgi:hypothetical protein
MLLRSLAQIWSYNWRGHTDRSWWCFFWSWCDDSASDNRLLVQFSCISSYYFMTNHRHPLAKYDEQRCSPQANTMRSNTWGDNFVIYEFPENIMIMTTIKNILKSTRSCNSLITNRWVQGFLNCLSAGIVNLLPLLFHYPESITMEYPSLLDNGSSHDDILSTLPQDGKQVFLQEPYQ